MLRDLLTRLPGVSTWPCDEINYIWRHYNSTIPHDEFTPNHARSRVKRYIRRAFDSRARREGCRVLVEKTCANSLRVPFVEAVIPEAKFIFLVRDGRDVVASAIKRWTAPLDVGYLLRKARFVPLSDIAYHGARYFAHRAHRVFSSQKRLSTWGPRFVGMREKLATSTLEEVCAAQWVNCVESAAVSFARMDANRVIKLRYEKLVQRPEREVTRLLDFLCIDGDSDRVRAATSGVSAQSIGNWRRLSQGVVNRIAPIVERQLAAFGYLSDEVSSRRHAA